MKYMRMKRMKTNNGGGGDPFAYEYGVCHVENMIDDIFDDDYYRFIILKGITHHNGWKEAPRVT